MRTRNRTTLKSALMLFCMVALAARSVTAIADAPATAEPTNAKEAAAQKTRQEAELEKNYQAWVASLTAEQKAWERVLQTELGSFYLPIHKRQKVAGQSNAWDFVADDPALPRVLLIGDSVSRAYTQTVRKELAGKANVHRAPANCGPTSTGLKKIDIWLGDGKWDVIHFNFGIHDRATPIADYTARLEQLVERMKQTGATLVWATTTPIPDMPDRKYSAASIVERNTAAARVMKKHDVSIDDLFAAITPRLAELQNPNDVHFNGAGNEFLGKQVAEFLKKVVDRSAIETSKAKTTSDRKATSNTSRASVENAASPKPNIVVIYADDLGYGDVQCYNPERGRIPTPHIDRLASQGMRFTDAHSSSGVCSPSRYTLLTGRYHWRSRLQGGIVGLWGAPLIAADRLTMGGLAKQSGYQTACIGKWHLGWNWPIPADRAAVFKQRPKGQAIASDQHRAVWRSVFEQPISGGPVSRGFDTYFGTDVPNWPPYCFLENDRTVGIPSEFLAARLLGNNQASNQGPALKDWTLEPILPALADRAEKFIAEAAQQTDPFLIYMPLTSPHTPLSVNDEWKGKSGLNLYADFVMETDAIVGRVIEAIEKSGEANDTLVVFTSDNGCAPYIGVADLEKQGHYPSGPLRGYKADAWEGGHRVPFIVRWPGFVKAATVCDQLVHQADLMATFAEVLGHTLPDSAGEDSFSMLPLLKGNDEPMRETSVSCSIRGVPSIRSGDWKYIAAPGSGGWGKGGDQSQPIQLYNLADDISESKNLAANQPQRVAELQALLETLITRGRSNPGTPQNNDVKVRRYAPKAVDVDRS